MDRIDEIRAREQAATPGPWGYDGMHNEIHAPETDKFFLIVSELREHPGEVLLDKFGHTYNADFEFIAHAREDIPWLIDCAETLENTAGEAIFRAHRLGKDNERLTAQVEALERAIRATADKCYACKNQNCGHYLSAGIWECKLFELDEVRFGKEGTE